ncbi:MAG: hypothetical protein OXU81_25085 [Gammaproteobacteria bacterium]|nr:hypothetical protein [Gammaproteobacteria bacterium]
MHGPGYRSLREAAARAMESGLRFLDGIIGADGAWPASGIFDCGRTVVPEWTPFAAAAGIVALEACGTSRAAALELRSRAFLHSRIVYPGVWRYYARLAPDLDDTALCSVVAGPHLWLVMGRNVGPILSCRDDEGLFRTWMLRGGEFESSPNLVDSVVNANVLAYLGDRPETQAAQQWLAKLVEEGLEPGTSPHYLSTMDLYAAMARASRLAPSVFARLRATLAARIVGLFEAGGETIDAYRMAQAVTALVELQASGEEEVIRRALGGLLEAQRADGGWPECLIWKCRPGVDGLFSSEALTTACCIGAMARAVRV